MFEEPYPHSGIEADAPSTTGPGLVWITSQMESNSRCILFEPEVNKGKECLAIDFLWCSSYLRLMFTAGNASEEALHTGAEPGLYTIT